MSHGSPGLNLLETRKNNFQSTQIYFIKRFPTQFRALLWHPYQKRFREL